MNLVSNLLAKAKELKLKIIYKPETPTEIHYFERWLACKISILQLREKLELKLREDAEVKRKQVNAIVKKQCADCLKERDKLRAELNKTKKR